MFIPSEFLIRDITIHTIWVFMAVSFLTLTFLFWYEGKKDGFDEDKLLDLMLLTLFVALFSFKFDILLVIAAIVLIIYGVANLWKWSTFRILDIFSLSAYAALIPGLIGASVIRGEYLMLLFIPVILVMYSYLIRVRNVKLKSGYVFSLLIFLIVTVSGFFVREPKHLIFYTFLFSMSLINLYLRERKSMIKPRLSVDFLRDIKSKLLLKDKRLKEEQNLLIEEDPYLSSGRDTDNAEATDEAILEDTRKELNDLRQSSLQRVHSQVRKALAMINIGTYGTCEVCGKPIDKARLKIYPEATTCIDHASNSQ